MQMGLFGGHTPTQVVTMGGQRCCGQGKAEQNKLCPLGSYLTTKSQFPLEQRVALNGVCHNNYYCQ